jgi:ubiquitin-like domain-containing CTD phosphatase 1
MHTLLLCYTTLCITEVHFIVQPRPGKKLLVLDLDHTLLDFSGRATGSLPGDLAALKRPHMDAFLTLVYREYDIAVWSQTSWRWLELKLTGTYVRQSTGCMHAVHSVLH